MDTAITKVKWQNISKVGMPTKELRFIDENQQVQRTFLLKGEYSISIGWVFSDGSGFETDSDDKPLEWAIIEGF
jgi:hypothetical protein